MKKNIFITALLVFFIFAGFGLSQTVHVIELRDFVFTPDTITVFVGDTVRWSAVQGLHNVRADDNSFTSGPPAPAPWTFNHIFSASGSNPYYCEPHGAPGGIGMSGVVTVEDPVSVSKNDFISEKFEMNQNYPNPFNPTTNIGFHISNPEFVLLNVFNVLGSEVAVLINEEKPAGYYEVEFDASDLTSGIYYYRINAGNYSETKKMILLR